MEDSQTKEKMSREPLMRGYADLRLTLGKKKTRKRTLLKICPKPMEKEEQICSNLREGQWVTLRAWRVLQEFLHLKCLQLVLLSNNNR